jgi:ADP-ribosylation factor 6
MRSEALTNIAPNPTAMSPHEITEKLQLARLRDRLWFVQPSVATAEQGLQEGFDWLSKTIKDASKK